MRMSPASSALNLSDSRAGFEAERSFGLLEFDEVSSHGLQIISATDPESHRGNWGDLGPILQVLRQQQPGLPGRGCSRYSVAWLLLNTRSGSPGCCCRRT